MLAVVHAEAGWRDDEEERRLELAEAGLARHESRSRTRRPCWAGTWTAGTSRSTP
ncbi:hypothetical protein FRACA_1050006 [Frankia canadensis]|uniref:Uncharacterized protein n=1 Tax=Frankia canadensis TaxID=1836972 RepID=A0A2I2KIX3_9ACTN|nr:hypothetical protein FRACA_1050006 [Frankia canadensis]SOU52912.1 hypothetical protein FRACA_1050006 [Frankia canadensis]